MSGGGVQRGNFFPSYPMQPQQPQMPQVAPQRMMDPTIQAPRMMDAGLLPQSFQQPQSFQTQPFMLPKDTNPLAPPVASSLAAQNYANVASFNPSLFFPKIGRAHV